MHELFAFCQWIGKTRLGHHMADSAWLFPVIETVHIFGVIALVGSTSFLDLRLMGLAFKQDPVSKLADRYLVWAWGGFAVQVITGFLLFTAKAVDMYNSDPFRVKLALIVLAGINVLIFHATTYRSVKSWDNDPVAPLGARIAGLASLVLWFGIVGAGRWIAYF
jgi:Family of unknown function (DUF6644)